MSDNLTLAQILSGAQLGRIPTDTELKTVLTGRSSDEALHNRRRIRMECQRIAELAEEGFTVRRDDLTEATMARFAEFSRYKSDRAAALDPAGEAAKVPQGGCPASDQQRAHDGRIRTSVRRALQGLLHRAADGEDISESEVKALVVREEVSDAQLAAFRGQLTGAIAEVRTLRGDIEQRDGRHAREQNAEDLADRRVADLMHAGVLDDQERSDHAEGTTDPYELAALVPRRSS